MKSALEEYEEFFMVLHTRRNRPVFSSPETSDSREMNYLEVAEDSSVDKGDGSRFGVEPVHLTRHHPQIDH